VELVYCAKIVHINERRVFPKQNVYLATIYAGTMYIVHKEQNGGVRRMINLFNAKATTMAP
jgi:hypothetical protein